MKPMKLATGLILFSSLSGLLFAQPDGPSELLTDCRAALNDDVSRAQLRFVRHEGEWQLLSLGATYCARVDLNLLPICPLIESLDVRVSNRSEVDSTRTGIATIAKYPSLTKLSIDAQDLVDQIDLDHTRLASVKSLGLEGDAAAVELVLGKLSAFPQLTTLQVDSAITDKSLMPLRECGSLRTLAVTHANITDDALTEFANLSELRSLDLTGCDMISAQGIKKLASLSNLNELTLGKIGEDTVAAFTSLPALENLTCSFHGRQADLTGLRRLRSWKLAEDDSVEKPPFKVYLPENVEQISCGYQYLPMLGGTSSQIKTVEVQGYWDTEESSLAWTRHLPMLMHLTVKSACEADVMDIARLQDLRSLTLVGPCSHFGPKSCAMLKGLKRLENFATENEQYHFDLTILEEMDDLKELSIPYTELVESDLDAIAKLSNLQSLRLWCADNPQFPVESAIKRLSALENLDELSLSNTVSDEGLRQLLALTKLRRLNLSRANGFSDAALADLMKSLPSLQEVIR